MLAGWLFADLFLVLLIAGLAALPAKSSTAAGPTTTTSPTTSTTPHNQGLDPKYVSFTIPLARRRTGAATRAATDAVNLLKRQSPVFGLSSGFGYWGGTHSNDFQLKVFFLN